VQYAALHDLEEARCGHLNRLILGAQRVARCLEETEQSGLVQSGGRRIPQCPRKWSKRSHELEPVRTSPDRDLKFRSRRLGPDEPYHSVSILQRDIVEREDDIVGLQAYTLRRAVALYADDQGAGNRVEMQFAGALVIEVSYIDAEIAALLRGDWQRYPVPGDESEQDKKYLGQSPHGYRPLDRMDGKQYQTYAASAGIRKTQARRRFVCRAVQHNPLSRDWLFEHCAVMIRRQFDKPGEFQAASFNGRDSLLRR
jgi:hypothetical protein